MAAVRDRTRAAFGVARASIREALKPLERDGMVDVPRGRGGFVSALRKLAVSSPITMFESVTGMLGESGLSLTTRVLRRLPTWLRSFSQDRSNRL